MQWLDSLRSLADANQMWWNEPLANVSIHQEIVFEWWHGNRKLTIYFLGHTAEYLKVWGDDIDNEMEGGSVVECLALWQWLCSSPKLAQI